MSKREVLLENSTEPNRDNPKLSVHEEGDGLNILLGNDLYDVRIVPDMDLERYFYKRTAEGKVRLIEYDELDAEGNKTGKKYTRNYNRERFEQLEEERKRITEASPDNIPQLAEQLERSKMQNEELQKIIVGQNDQMKEVQESHADTQKQLLDMQEMLQELNKQMVNKPAEVEEAPKAKKGK